MTKIKEKKFVSVQNRLKHKAIIK